MKTLFILVLIYISAGFTTAIEFKNEEKVVLLGNAFIERDVNFGHIETHLALALSDKRPTFRNLGWSGDTVYGHARSYFGPPQEGFDRLKKHIQFLNPTLVLMCYGAVSSFDGEPGLGSFLEGYKKLMGMIRSTSAARIVLVSPPPCENLGFPLPDMEPQNKRLALYSEAIKKLAAEENCDFVNLFEALGAGKKRLIPPVTINGLHFSEQGYKKVAVALGDGLKVKGPNVDSPNKEKLRQIIMEKNKLFFNRWRPQNETYLHGFRKHEQGNNAKEIPQFDPLIANKDKNIQEIALRLSAK
ncbi:MAG: SGNH/GDSL hydrolase family protein [Akkermansiaceae bacterium]|jgi:lysophospholipase L1-like esterase|nr:SGNH/GDSL hydrolase family protein [Akkermansiaceae bacterium]